MSKADRSARPGVRVNRGDRQPFPSAASVRTKGNGWVAAAGPDRALDAGRVAVWYRHTNAGPSATESSSASPASSIWSAWPAIHTADAVVNRIRDRISNGDIVVMHDGDESAPLADQRHTVEATARLIPALRARGFAFGVVCEVDWISSPW